MTRQPLPDIDTDEATSRLPVAAGLAVRQLRFERLRQGLTQADVAARLAVTRQAVAAWESDDTGVTLSTLCRWAQALAHPLQLVWGDVVIDEQGRLPDVPSTHVSITGPTASAWAPHVAALNPGGRTVALCAEESVGEALARLLADWDERISQRLPSEHGTLIVDLDELSTAESTAAVGEALSRARSAGWMVVLASTSAIPEFLARNVATRLRVSGDRLVGTEATGGPCTWRRARP